MLNKLIAIAFLAGLTLAVAPGAAKAQTASRLRVIIVPVDADSALTNKVPSKDKPSKKKNEPKQVKNNRPTPGPMGPAVPPPAAESDEDDEDQLWETELFVNRDPRVFGDVNPVVAK